ncbi:single-stranded DNA-binding protein [Cohnella sp. GCM10027633]|uniref:single-stranded DNA-binding protein n=1 Tax=unclassified Cohnella TaxID=2636738 RepID=UPI00362F4C91
MNKVVLSGRWSKDIDFKALDSGKTVAKSSIAVDEGYGDKKQTFFFEVEMWGKTAEAVANYSGKGKKVLIEGRLKVEQWVKDGQK